MCRPKSGHGESPVGARRGRARRPTLQVSSNAATVSSPLAAALHHFVPGNLRSLEGSVWKGSSQWPNFPPTTRRLAHACQPSRGRAAPANGLESPGRLADDPRALEIAKQALASQILAERAALFLAVCAPANGLEPYRPGLSFLKTAAYGPGEADGEQTGTVRVRSLHFDTLSVLRRGLVELGVSPTELGDLSPGARHLLEVGGVANFGLPTARPPTVALAETVEAAGSACRAIAEQDGLDRLPGGGVAHAIGGALEDLSYCFGAVVTASRDRPALGIAALAGLFAEFAPCAEHVRLLGAHLARVRRRPVAIEEALGAAATLQLPGVSDDRLARAATLFAQGVALEAGAAELVWPAMNAAVAVVTLAGASSSGAGDAPAVLASLLEDAELSDGLGVFVMDFAMQPLGLAGTEGRALLAEAADGPHCSARRASELVLRLARQHASGLVLHQLNTARSAFLPGRPPCSPAQPTWPLLPRRPGGSCLRLPMPIRAQTPTRCGALSSRPTRWRTTGTPPPLMAASMSSGTSSIA